MQVQVNPKAQMDYSTLLKAALRHHPDIFIVGEIRDQKTARAVLTAALSGHLVLSTLHATLPQSPLSHAQIFSLSQW